MGPMGVEFLPADSETAAEELKRQEKGKDIIHFNTINRQYMIKAAKAGWLHFLAKKLVLKWSLNFPMTLTVTRVVALGFQLSGGKFVGPRDMFADKSFDNARQQARDVADFLRRHGPFEPHRLPLEEMEYTTMPDVMKKLEGRFVDLD